MREAGKDSRGGGAKPGPRTSPWTLRAREMRSPEAKYAFERELGGKPDALVCGVDEAGRGPLAGPVVAAAVILKPGFRLSARVTDSKMLDLAGRKRAMDEIAASALCLCWREVGPAEIDRINIRQASFLAMRRSVEGLGLLPDVIVTDGEPCPDMPAHTVGFPKADFLVPVVSAASIVAKLVRDVMMEGLSRRYPLYGFERHKGYPSPEHLAALREHGPCEAHRKSYAPVRACLELSLGLTT